MNASLTCASGRIARPLLSPIRIGILGALLLLASCESLSRVPPLPPAEPLSPPATSPRLPDWVGEPMSSEKLASIETWLATDGPTADPFWRVEGELALGRGRMDLPQGEKSGQKAPDSPTRMRLRTARAGFERVIAGSDATAGQRKRAQDGRTQCDRLLGVQTAAVRAALPLIGREQWGAVPANFRHMDKNRGGWKRITVHHSAERKPPELDGTLAESAAAVRSIQRAHMDGKETGYGDIGYHFVIDPYGRVFQGRDMTWQGAHAAGDNNVQNVGVCLIGNFDEERPSKPALDGLRRLLDNLRSKWKIPRTAVLNHQELKSTECPGRNLARWVESYRRSGATAPIAAALGSR